MPVPSPLSAPSPAAPLAARLEGLSVRDRHRLGRRLGRIDGTDKASDTFERLTREVEEAETRIARRRASVPTVTYPTSLPVSDHRDELLATLSANQVVIVAGETGSGKSTQLPKLCLEAGRGVRGLIGHTQPRRLAARAVAERVADELGTAVGGLVGYTVRFTDRVSDDTLVKVMTDGILLAEIQRDPLLTRYDTIIVDEAHERSLNIDFILGYLRRLLPRRPDLGVVITSATIDTERFSRHFDDAPVVSVSGRTYPVEVRYRPVADEVDDRGRDQTQAIGDAIEELAAEGPGDILVFLSGEREIRDTADAVAALDLPGTEILPLYARLSAAEQHRVFRPHPGRRVVLATNVAETSITVPGIRYVVDPGTARISRYNRRTKVQRLPIEGVSQASANQRAGRCGRVAPGVCIRLYGEDDFASRPEFTEPEILRTNLASVILQMAALGLGDIEAFPFVEAPDRRAIGDGIALLTELGALDPDRAGTAKWLTPLGRKLAKLPIDPRLGRMVLEAERQGCLREIVVLAAALSIQDPRERPTGQEQAAAERHRRFADERSDFVTLLNLWDDLRRRQRELSSNQFRRLCRSEFLNHLRIREWQDITTQLRELTKSLGMRANREPADPDAIHRAALAGLLSQVGLWDPDKREYIGARNARFVIAPGSSLTKKSPRWVMAAELVETNRLRARVAAPVKPEWLEELGAHLVRRSFGDPRWDERRGQAMVDERVTLFGLPVVAARAVPCSRVDAAGARELFIEHALVRGEWRTHHRFFAGNAERIDEVRSLEDRLRRRDVLVGADAVFAFYDERVPPQVTSARHFDRWWRSEQRRRPDLLDLGVEQLVDSPAASFDLDEHPDVWRQGNVELGLSYVFDPGVDADGVTVHVPLAALADLLDVGFDWHVPGLRHELVTALLRALPKQLRREIGPAPDAASAFLRDASPADGPLVDVLAGYVRRVTGMAVPPGCLSLDSLPPHLRLTFSVEDDEGKTVAAGKDLPVLVERLERRVRSAATEATGPGPGGGERSGLRTWSLGTLAPVVELHSGGHTVRAYPALVDEGESVGVRLMPDEAAQAQSMWAGTRRLLLLTVAVPGRAAERALTNEVKLAAAKAGYRSTAELRDDCAAAAVDLLMELAGGPAWDADGFAALRAAVAAGLPEAVAAVAADAARVLVRAAEVEARLSRMTAPALTPSVTDMRGQLEALVHPGFVSGAGAGRLADVARYVTGIERRSERAPADLGRDEQRMTVMRRLEEAWRRARAECEPACAAEAAEVGWLLEELRISLFAQVLGTARPVSEKRVLQAIEGLRA